MDREKLWRLLREMDDPQGPALEKSDEEKEREKEDISLWAYDIEPDVTQRLSQCLDKIKKVNPKPATADIDSFIRDSEAPLVIQTAKAIINRYDGSHVIHDREETRKLYNECQMLALFEWCDECSQFPATYQLQLLNGDKTVETVLGKHRRDHWYDRQDLPNWSMYWGFNRISRARRKKGQQGVDEVIDKDIADIAAGIADNEERYAKYQQFREEWRKKKGIDCQDDSVGAKPKSTIKSRRTKLIAGFIIELNNFWLHLPTI